MSHKRVAVIGAGIIGLSTAYYLQKTGYQVILIDKQEPGTGKLITDLIYHGREINSMW